MSVNDWQNDLDRTSAENIARPLRGPVRLDDTFEVRVMSAVHAEGLARVDAMHAKQKSAEAAGGKWWSRRYTVSISAFSGLAMAASIFGIMFLGATMLSRPIHQSATVAMAGVAVAPPDARNVQFILVNGSARQVYLVGDFNGWSKTATPLVRAANGNAWTVSVPLPNGRHEYAFIVSDDNGERWLADPLTPTVEDEFGTESSIIRVES